MAKQGKKVIQERQEQLLSLGFTADDKGCYKLKERLIKPELIATFIKEQWDEMIAEIKMEEDIPATVPGAETVEAFPQPQPESETMNVENDIVKLDVNDVVIAEWKIQYGGRVIENFEDKENLTKVQEGKKFIQKKRTALEARRKRLKQPYLDGGNKIDAAANKYKIAIVDIETPLDAELEKFEKWKQAEEIRKREEEEAEIKRRIELLKDAGITYDGSFYVVGDSISMDIITIKGMSGVNFDALVEKVKIEKKRIDDEAAELFRKQEEELETLRNQRLQLRSTVATSIGLEYSDTIDAGRPGYYFKNEYADFVLGMFVITDTDDGVFSQTVSSTATAIKDAKQKVIDAAAQKVEDEKESLRRQKITLREGMAKTIGLIFSVSMPGYIFKNDFADFSLGMDVIKTASDEEYQKTIEDFGTQIIEAKQKQTEKQRQAAEELEKKQKEEEDEKIRKREQYIERQNSLVNLGMVLVSGSFVLKNEFGDNATISVDEVHAIDPDSWGNRLLNLGEAIKEVRAQADEKRLALEREREALKPQLQRTREYFSNILAVSKPDIQEVKLKDILSQFSLDLTAAINKANDNLLKCE